MEKVIVLNGNTHACVCAYRIELERHNKEAFPVGWVIALKTRAVSNETQAQGQAFVDKGPITF